MPTMSLNGIKDKQSNANHELKWYKRQAIECQPWALNGLKDKLSGANHGL